MFLALEIYEKAMKMLSATRPKKADAYNLLKTSASMNHVPSRIAVAWAQLLGTPLPQDIDSAKKTFQELAEQGVADAHMVKFFFLNIFIYRKGKL